VDFGDTVDECGQPDWRRTAECRLISRRSNLLVWPSAVDDHTPRSTWPMKSLRPLDAGAEALEDLLVRAQ